jgi:DNA-binding response OmpR family regulator
MLENELFEYFLRNVNRTCTKYDIAEAIWGEGSYAERSIDDRIYQLVARVREKLASEPANNLQIVTVRGRGYRPQRRE